MRLKLKCIFEEKGTVPFNYSYGLQSVVYKLINNSSPEFSAFLHNEGFVEQNKPFKLFTFSKLLQSDGLVCKEGLKNVSSFSLYFSTPIEESYKHLVLGIFSGKKTVLTLPGYKPMNITIAAVESLPEPEFTTQTRFLSLSPVAVSTMIERSGRMVQHYLDYTDPLEKKKFKENLHGNLLKKYRLIKKRAFTVSSDFDIEFDKDYIARKGGKIRKQIRFKKDKTSEKYSYIIGMEAPFTVKTDPELIKIGYQCGFGEKNSAGFGMAEVIK